ncbi:glycosyltransferase family 4 protein [Marinobacter litoralis]|uniref:glycosyltransferase family 4 protein n=1 Tax=Marinobacter litoralis TaxID=187981 RepID=UPI0018ED2F0A|nr:glycosyltransferase family 4 protein [Marinobacter litoralis]MBJ6137693.1 glycosyltransferase family 4 protein [Marinobacter litoralis]
MSDNSLRSDERFRVLVVVRWPVGGIRTFLRYVYQHFDKEQFEFTFVGASTGNSGTLESDLSSIFSEWVLFPENGTEVWGCFNAVLNALKNNKYDLVHAHGFTSAISSVLPARLLRVPLICTSHDVLNSVQFKGPGGWLKKVVLGLALCGCSKVHSVSSDAQANLKATLPILSRSKHVVIRNGIQARKFRNAKKIDLKDELSLGQTDVLIGFFGRFMGQKGFSILVDAVEYLKTFMPSVSIKIVCVGSGGFIREEMARLEKRGLSGYFYFLPFTPDIGGYLKACDLVVMPSLWEACPLQPMEALCAGVPFVGSDCIGLREVLADTPAVVVEAGSAESLAQGIVDCLEKGRQPFDNFSSEAVERFEVSKTVEQIQLMYEQVCR